MASLKIDKLYKLCLDEFHSYLINENEVASYRGNVLRYTDPVLTIHVSAASNMNYSRLILLFGENKRNKTLLDLEPSLNIFIINSKKDFTRIKKLIEESLYKLEKEIFEDINNEFTPLTKKDGTIYDIMNRKQNHL